MAAGAAAEIAAGDGAPRGKLENLTLWERVHHFLRQEILSNRLPPGTELAEVALAESLGVSRGPVREALGRLATEGLVVVRPRRGAVVSSLSKQEFLETYQVREALEMLAIRLAVPRMTPELLERLQALVGEMQACADRDDVDGFFELNAQFHQTFVDASGNGRLTELYRQLVEQLGRYRGSSLALRGSLKRSIAEHRAILRAVASGEADRAAHLISEHIRVPQRRLEASDGEPFEPGTIPAKGEPR
ncbi:MAG: GntR family transcriptional regulator [Thermoleophilia bacterium]|nr:GntR family transcriptional regulator [Thermoleophilia bacterium]